ncbi:MAG: imidazole glycerol phosphate synthase subunit HisH [Deltaproteobacteria bacterium HGW-Deltaproteobacteria-12]|jgi:glutamine amidotransferase|nr:MAG: imidazole glycerol phosphate synthase subunit HisH [Deltaproteobacteria bacterium HGW-Deltaproteobacteria-12]
MCEKKKISIAIVDYEAGNLFSVEHACIAVGLKPLITSKPEDILLSDALILPGVGAFGDAIKNLHKLNLIQPLQEFAASGKPFMGICLGMQLLFSKSEEFGEHEGLNLIAGDVIKFPSANKSDEKVKIPQIGWNQIFHPPDVKGRWDGTPLEKINDGEFMYFVHSFYAVPKYSENILAVTEYGDLEYCSAVIKNNIFATQFHPEKSAAEGIKIYQDWANKIIGNTES